MVAWELGKPSFKKDAEFAFGAAQPSSFFSHLHSSFFCLPFPLKAEFFHSANGFYIVSDQIFSYPTRNLSSAETHKSTYGPPQLRPVYTFPPH